MSARKYPTATARSLYANLCGRFQYRVYDHTDNPIGTVTFTPRDVDVVIYMGDRDDKCKISEQHDCTDVNACYLFTRACALMQCNQTRMRVEVMKSIRSDIIYVRADGKCATFKIEDADRKDKIIHALVKRYGICESDIRHHIDSIIQASPGAWVREYTPRQSHSTLTARGDTEGNRL